MVLIASRLVVAIAIVAAIVAGLVRLLQAKEILTALKMEFLAIPEKLDVWYYELAARSGWRVPTLAGAPLREYSLSSPSPGELGDRRRRGASRLWLSQRF